MSKQILINSNHYETRVALLEDSEIKQLHIEREEDKNVVGNVYLGVVKRVLPGMQAAFLELGLERTAFLYVDDIIDEPFGSDVDVLEEDDDDEEISEDAGPDREDRELKEEREETEEEKGSEEEETLVIEEDSTQAPVLLAPEEQDAPEEAEAPGEETEGENDEEEEDDEENLDEDFQSAAFRPENEPDFEITDSEPEEPQVTEPLPSSLSPVEAVPEETQTVESVSDEEIEEDEGPQPGNEKLPGQPQDRPQRGRPSDGRRRDPRRHGGRGHYRSRSSREHQGRGPDRPERSAERGGDRNDRGDRNNRGERSEQNRDTRGGDRGPRQGRRDGRRYESREGRSSRRPRYQRNNKRRGFSRRRRSSANIQDLLKEGQEILVQVAKAPIGTKGARLTTHISLPGRNLVLMPTVKHLGISRRIDSDRERRRLRDIFTKRLKVKGVGFIIRTVAEGKTFRELKADADYLVRTWQNIKKDSSQKRAPALIHEDLSLTYRTVRDYFTEDVDSLVIDNPADHDGIQDFIGQFMPQLKSKVKLFKGPSQLFEHYGIEAEISRALSKKVWLKSGGYLLIDQSEALTAIDVNTGRYVGSKSLEETILRTNLEAVKEIAYQLRVRNVGGIIIIDLIDMESAHNREKVFNALQDALMGDKSKTNILKISELGLVEMTRKRTHEDLIRYLTESCPSCDGRGYTKSRRTVAFEIFREIEKEALSQTKNIVVFASPGVVSLLAKDESRHVGLLEKRFGKNILVKTDNSFHTEQFEVFGKH